MMGTISDGNLLRDTGIVMRVRMHPVLLKNFSTPPDPPSHPLKKPGISRDMTHFSLQRMGVSRVVSGFTGLGGVGRCTCFPGHALKGTITTQILIISRDNVPITVNPDAGRYDTTR